MTPKKEGQMAAPAGDAKPRRKNKPEYVVFRLALFSPEQEGEKGTEAWVPLLGHTQQGEPKSVQAASRKEAIRKATSGDEALAQGAFMVVPKQECQILKRKTRTEVVDEFS
jgi:hypothetical protein